MEDKLRIANKVNKKYKELMNELDENINQATEDIGNDEAKALLENKRNLTAEKSKNLSLKPRPFLVSYDFRLTIVSYVAGLSILRYWTPIFF